MTEEKTANKILSIENSPTVLQRLHAKHARIVLTGGCFDILHIGHITFLEAAKKVGDTLLILLESDETISRAKGPNRPVNSQEDRARLLGAFAIVDYVILLPDSMTDQRYDALVLKIKPAIIATTKGDAYRFHKERQADSVGGKVIDVTDPIKDQSTSRIFKILSEI
jgi:D-beta-D-heptose 7-phosphate kinase/D-beta-D-heptose 1-phosphate adenosyltransferase